MGPKKLMKIDPMFGLIIPFVKMNFGYNPAKPMEGHAHISGNSVNAPGIFVPFPNQQPHLYPGPAKLLSELRRFIPTAWCSEKGRLPNKKGD